MAAEGSGWLRVIETARDAPEDIAEPGKAAVILEDRHRVQPRSVVLLFARGE